jgi:hypothetical protein
VRELHSHTVLSISLELLLGKVKPDFIVQIEKVPIRIEKNLPLKMHH